MKRRGLVAVGTIGALLLVLVPALGGAVVGSAPAVTRLAGADRYATSAAIAATYATPQATVFVASGAGFADALSAAPVAGHLGAPLVLVAPTTVPTPIRTQLERLKPAHIVVLGGPAAVSATVVAALGALTVPAGGVTRLAAPGGGDRYTTSAAVLGAYYPTPPTGQTTPVAYVASGANFPDGLAVGPVAGAEGAPLALVPSTTVPAVIDTQLRRLRPLRLVIIGGTSSVSAAVATHLAGDLAPGGTVARWSGADRYATAAAVSRNAFPGQPAVATVYVAAGTNFPDALSAAPLAAKAGVPLLLVPPGSVPAATSVELSRLGTRALVILGSEAAVSARTTTTLSDFLDTTPPPAGCPVFPADHVWNEPVTGLPVAADSAALVARIGLGSHLHADFDAVGDGIPYTIVSAGTPRTAVTFTYNSESDHVAYPIPAAPLIEAGSDRHMVLVDPGACRLWELYDATLSGGTWHAGSGATWDLRSNALRPAGWTSADAAGLPILPGLARYDEVASGAILHALRFTAPSTCAGYLYPARHEAGSGTCSATSDPPMGLRVRLKASVDISGFGPQARVVLTALRTYGMILADNGSPWFVSGEPDARWDDDDLHQLQTLHGTDFEVLDTSGLVNGP